MKHQPGRIAAAMEQYSFWVITACSHTLLWQKHLKFYNKMLGSFYLTGAGQWKFEFPKKDRSKGFWDGIPRRIPSHKLNLDQHGLSHHDSYNMHLKQDLMHCGDTGFMIPSWSRSIMKQSKIPMIPSKTQQKYHLKLALIFSACQPESRTVNLGPHVFQQMGGPFRELLIHRKGVKQQQGIGFWRSHVFVYSGMNSNQLVNDFMRFWLAIEPALGPGAKLFMYYELHRRGAVVNTN